jgi:predicted metal-dependent peptidase
VSIARAANSGTLPEYLAPLVDELNAPRISWRDQLQEFIDDAATRELDWNKPNKRFLGSGFILPGSVNASVGKVAAIVDTSGSIGRATLAAFRDELQGLLDDGRVETLAVVYCHARVSGETEFRAGDSVVLESTETGGTAFAPAFRHVAAFHPEAAAIVYLTDLMPGYGSDAWGPEPETPVLWCVDGTMRAAPFGTVLPLDPHA